ncbi:MAG: S8 family serine peptidase [Myxococcaceae bacterium]|nr:S8 family serine peptidase [Myxococcaceae bacterium]
MLQLVAVVALVSADVIHLRSRVVELDGGIEMSVGTGHVLVALDEPLTPAMKDELRRKGVRLTEHVEGLAYLALVMSGVVPKKAGVRWAGAFGVDDKISPSLSDAGASGDGGVNVYVLFHGDIERARAEAVLRRHVRSFEVAGSPQSFTTTIDHRRLEQLANDDAVKSVEPGPLPPFALNDTIRQRLGLDDVQAHDASTGVPSYSGLSGAGVRVAVMDTGIDPGHDDFWRHDVKGKRTSCRVLHLSGGDSHGTNVAGIIGGNGWQSARADDAGTANAGEPFQWRGAAPDSTLLSYEPASASTRIWNDAINVSRAQLSNHSYEQGCAYDGTAAGIDAIVRGGVRYGTKAIPARPAVWAAGNNGGQARLCKMAGYFSVVSPAKNPIVVGATVASDATPSALQSFSSLGPTFDGRIKPDVMAPGCVDQSPSMINGYEFNCGTSMAAPGVTGVIALLLQEWHQRKKMQRAPLPSTMKALLVHGASDMVDEKGNTDWVNPDTDAGVKYYAGPDWATGYGLVDARASVVALREKRYVEGTTSSVTQRDVYEVTVTPDAGRLRVTLAWDDEPGSTLTSETTPKLVNDLDLTVTAPDGGVALPWVLPPLPQNLTAADIVPATRGEDHLNNVEQVEVANPSPGTWRVTVRAHALPNANAQPYSLVSDFALRIPTKKK